MSLQIKRDIIININMYVHYPETYNANTISNNFCRYFFNRSIFDKDYNINCYLMINSAPHDVNESLEIEISLNNDNIIVDKEVIIDNLKEFITKSFNNQINDISVEFISNK